MLRSSAAADGDRHMWMWNNAIKPAWLRSSAAADGDRHQRVLGKPRQVEEVAILGRR